VPCTIACNILSGVTSGQLARNPNRNGQVWRAVRLASLFGITVTGIVYATVLAKVHEPHGWQETSTNTAFHYIVPIMMLLGWLSFGPRRLIDGRTIALSILWPIAWTCYIVIYGRITKWSRTRSSPSFSSSRPCTGSAIDTSVQRPASPVRQHIPHRPLSDDRLDIWVILARSTAAPASNTGLHETFGAIWDAERVVRGAACSGRPRRARASSCSGRAPQRALSPTHVCAERTQLQPASAAVVASPVPGGRDALVASRRASSLHHSRQTQTKRPALGLVPDCVDGS